MPSKKRIAFVTNTSWSIYKFRLYLLQVLVQKGYDVYVLAPRDAYTTLFEQLEGITYIELKKLEGKSISFIDDLQLYKELLHHYRDIQPHLVFHYTIKANIYGSLAASRAGCPAISIVTGLGYMFTGKNILKFAASKLYGYALKKNKEVWLLNRDDQDFFIDAGLVSKEKTFLLPGEGVDTNLFYTSPFREKQEPIVFLLIARLIEHKGIREFAAAAAFLQSKNIHAQFQLLGFSDDKSAVAVPANQLAQWQKAGNIIYMGTTDNVVSYIAKADCIVLPSYREGMPLSLLEGASMCKALVATDVPGCREIVQQGVNGFLCASKDAKALADAMEKYYQLPPAEKTAMGLAGRDIVTKQFTKEIITDIYLWKLDTLIKEAG